MGLAIDHKHAVGNELDPDAHVASTVGITDGARLTKHGVGFADPTIRLRDDLRGHFAIPLFDYIGWPG
jgi:hypothetical protein